MNDGKNKILLLIAGIVLGVVIISGVTFSYFTWQSSSEQGTNVVFTAEKNFQCAADGGGDITSDDVMLAPASCTNSKYAIQRTVLVTPTIYADGMIINMDLWLDIETLDTGLSDSQNFRYALTTSNTSCTEDVVASGNFNGKREGGKINLFDKNISSSAPQLYYLYIWLDGAETSSDTMDQNFKLSLNGQCTSALGPGGENTDGAEPPVLDSGMIPVTIANDGTVTTVSPDGEWYNYGDSRWANAILVTESSRNTYRGTNGVEVDHEDVLAYYVWIPRYKYKLFPPITASNSGEGFEQVIDIVFEEKNAPRTAGTLIDQYLTHPAFWWDDDSDGIVDSGEMLAGIWVGKFETAWSNEHEVMSVLPGLYSEVGNSVSTQFNDSLLFAGGTLSNGVVTFNGSSVYGLSASVDSHMMKNRDWGAVAYLAHSNYGVARDVYPNNDEITGVGYGGIGVGVTYYYGESDLYPNSTTGNITGVFDMSGGHAEAVMANAGGYTGNRGGFAGDANSGFNGPAMEGSCLLEGDTSSYCDDVTDGIDFPPLKYYDLYLDSDFPAPSEYDSSFGKMSWTLCTIDTCGGHALYETAGWYGSFAQFFSEEPWLTRGYYYGDNEASGRTEYGIFVFYKQNGTGMDSNMEYAWRSVLVIK